MTDGWASHGGIGFGCYIDWTWNEKLWLGHCVRKLLQVRESVE
jgi:hypothetical protein